MKKFAFLFAVLMLLTILPVSADEPLFPNEFWPLNDKYTAAMAAEDNLAIIESTKGIVDVFAGRWDYAAVANVSVKYMEMGNAYQRLGMYEDMVRAYTASFPYYEKYAELGLGSSIEILRILNQRIADWYESTGQLETAAAYYEKVIGYYNQYPAEGLGDATESIATLRDKIRYYIPTLDLYRTYYGYQTYYGAINEKRMGLLWGIAADGGVRSQIPNESMTLIYQEFGTPDSGYNAKLLREAEEAGLAVEFALNLPGEGAQLAEVLTSKDYIMDVIALLNSVDVPVFLRFGAEMDTWTVRGDPAAFVEAFRFVADLVHANTDHVAMVWSPTYGREWMMDVHAFYPGDEYVDWIGISLYLTAHAMGRTQFTEQELTNMAYFKAGNYAEPVRIMQELIEAYGDRKPFMISESGASHYYRQLDGKTASEDQTAWAWNRLTMLYKYLPMAYPQIKLIAHFDVVRENELCDFALSTNPLLTELYLFLVRDDAFIQNSWQDEANATYQKLEGWFQVEQGWTEFRTMAYYLGHDNVTVTYLIDGVPVASTSVLPYTVPMDLSDLAIGNHTFTVRAEADGKILGEKHSTMFVSKAADIYVNGEWLELSQKPLIVEGTTLVPLRAVVEKLGGKVEWIGETRSIIITDNDTEIVLRIGSYDMTKNGVTSQLAVPARLINSSTYIPLRAVAEAMGAEVGWEGTTKTITINKN